MNLDFLNNRIQTILVVDTSKEIADILGWWELSKSASVFTLFSLVLLGSMYSGEITTATKITSLVSTTLMSIVINQTNVLFPREKSTYDSFLFALFAICALMFVKFLPLDIRAHPLVARTKFLFTYTASRKIMVCLPCDSVAFTRT
jgi:hypothetical protein